ncbi:2TM domain-containing protein [Maribacter aestuarii]|uniref:2TM domain-containing protein n=1 Tax=Maribacter aestuarii TaxID=1130723 RepID=UPI00248C9B05|nr:2TM domain-containing protein [Maribacter aestuarii]
MESKQSEKFLKAQKRVNDMKKFYRHLRVYVVINILLLVVKLNLFNWFKDDYVWMQEKNFSDWASLNLLGTPIIWGIGLAIHGLYVFKFKSQTWQELKPEFLKKWEKRQLEKFLREENED